MEDTTCFVCADEVTKFVTCACGFAACVECTKTYLLGCNLVAHCMKCKVGWGAKFMYDAFGRAWVESNKEDGYRTHRKNVALDREKSRIPETLMELPRLRAEEEARKNATNLLRELREKKQRLRQELREVEMMLREAQGEVRPENKKTYVVTFLCKCPMEGCVGLIDKETFRCAACEIKMCKRCRERKIKGHKCDPNTIETIKMLKADTKPCPVCATQIHKIEGCFAPETEILLWNSNIVQAKDVKIGMKLIGQDGTPRKVVDLVHGYDEMYEVVQTKGEKYIVNGKHKLSLKIGGQNVIAKNNNSFKVQWLDTNEYKSKSKKFENETDAIEFKNTLPDINILNITVDEYMKLSNTVKKLLYGYRSNNCVQWPEKELDIDPYILGVWLGDGNSNGHAFACADTEIITRLLKWSKTIDAELVHSGPYRFDIRRAHSGKRIALGDVNCSIDCVGCKKKVSKECAELDGKYPVDKGMPESKSNPWKDMLRKHDLIDNKHIPEVFMKNSRSNRLALLAGLIDTDGSLANDGKRIVIIQVNPILSKHIELLARSLGLCVHITIRHVRNHKCPGVERKDYSDQFRINISGEISEIPTILPRKKCVDSQPNKDIFITSIKVVLVGKGEFYGWAVEGKDKLFVLSDYTTVHNCDQMFCVSCKTPFSWNTGQVESGTVHNPHAIAWMREHQKLERDINDIPCGGLVEMVMIDIPPKPFRQVQNIHRIIAEIDYKLNQNTHRDPFSSFRLTFVQKNICEATWRQKIFIAERENERRKANADILVTFRTLGIERFRNFAEELHENRKSWRKFYDKFISDMNEIRIFINKAFKDELPLLGTKKPFQIDADWKWASNRQRRGQPTQDDEGTESDSEPPVRRPFQRPVQRPAIRNRQVDEDEQDALLYADSSDESIPVRPVQRHPREINLNEIEEEYTSDGNELMPDQGW